MSRSWIDWRRWSSATSQPTIGLAIGRRTLALSEVRTSGDTPEIVDVAYQKLPAPLFEGKPTPAHADMLRTALAQLKPELGKRYVPLHVAVPNPIVAFEVFALDELPSNRKAQSDLAQWLMTKERYSDGAVPVCIAQPLGKDDTKHLLLVGALDAQWHECLLDALRAVGAVAWTLNAAAIYRHNRLSADAAIHLSSAALVALDSESWTLTVWDQDARPRLIRSRWRSPSAGELAAITEEVERTILTYIHAAAGRTVKTVYATATSDEKDGLQGALNARLTAPCTWIDPGVILNDKRMPPDTDGAFALALAAA